MHSFDSYVNAQLRASDMDRVGRRGPFPAVPVVTPRWRRGVGRLLVRAGQRIERPRPATSQPGPATGLAVGPCC